jgi:hypothetical protein
MLIKGEVTDNVYYVSRKVNGRRNWIGKNGRYLKPNGRFAKNINPNNRDETFWDGVTAERFLKEYLAKKKHKIVGSKDVERTTFYYIK